MERIIQIASDEYGVFSLTNEGRIFRLRGNVVDKKWDEVSLPPLHTDEIDHEAKKHFLGDDYAGHSEGQIAKM